MKITVFGATGVVGRALLPLLLPEHDLVAVSRSAHPPEPGVRWIEGDASSADDVARAVEGAEVVYYLVHSLGTRDFERQDRIAAQNVAQASERACVRQIVYLGGLGDDSDDLSPHLRSRRQVEELLGSDGVPVTSLRAGIIVGHGGVSWELTRQLVEHLPAMVTPTWVRTRTQPIAVADVVRYLVGVLEVPEAAGRALDIGGPEVLEYLTMMRRLAVIQGRRMLVVPVPLLTPQLSSRWLSLVTDVDTQTGRSLIDSMSNEVIVRDDAIRSLVPFEPMGYDEAVLAALGERAKQARTSS